MAFILSWMPPAMIHLYLQTCQRRECSPLACLQVFWQDGSKKSQSNQYAHCWYRNLLHDIYIICSEDTNVAATHRHILNQDLFLQEEVYYVNLVSRGGEVDSILSLQYVRSTENAFNYNVWKIHWKRNGLPGLYAKESIYPVCPVWFVRRIITGMISSNEKTKKL